VVGIVFQQVLELKKAVTITEDAQKRRKDEIAMTIEASRVMLDPPMTIHSQGQVGMSLIDLPIGTTTIAMLPEMREIEATSARGRLHHRQEVETSQLESVK